MKLSKKYELNSNDLQSILRNLAIIYWPVLMLLLNQLQEGNFDFKVLYALAISVTIDVIRRFLKDYTQWKN